MTDIQKEKISFFVPCLNEEAYVGRAIENIIHVMREFGDPYEILVVDDASKDKTVLEVWDCQARFPHVSIQLVQNPYPRGIGRNYFITAQRATGEYYILVNGNAIDSPESLKTILSHRGEAEAVISYLGKERDQTLFRHFSSWFFTALVNVVSGHRLQYYNGPVLHRTENVRTWFAETSGFGYQAELLSRLLDEGLSFLEVPISNSPRDRSFWRVLRFSKLFSLANTVFHIFLRRLERLMMVSFTSSLQRPAPLSKPPAIPIKKAACHGFQWETVRGWTETKAAQSFLTRPKQPQDCASAVKFAADNGLTVCPKGAGYSYADMILNQGQIIVDTSHMKRIIHWNPDLGQLTVEPGVTVSQVLAFSLLEGWTLPSCTGGMGVTIGGGISNNVHGKDSWKEGNFGNHVLHLKMLTAKGETLQIDREKDAGIFKAIVGGMGLLGIFLEITLQLKKIPSPFVQVVTKPVRHMEEALETIEQARAAEDFIITWVDAFADQKQLGRGVVEVARWIESPRGVSKGDVEKSLTVPKRFFNTLPATLVWNTARPFFRPALLRGANVAKYRWQRLRGKKSRELLFTDFNFMLNKIPGWKQLYRPFGYLEFQPLLPRKRGLESLTGLLKLCHRHQAQSLLCGLKYHRPDDFYLSYEGDGYSIGIDIALRGRKHLHVKQFAQELYAFVLQEGGKVFLAKDEMLTSDFFKRMYPQYRRFLEVKQRLDPNNLFVSDMYRRLFLQ